MNLIKSIVCAVVYTLTGTRSWREFILFLGYGAFLIFIIYDILGVYQ